MKTANIVNVMTKQHRIPKAQKTWAAIITIVVIAIVIAVSSFINMPRNLGKEIVFIKKVNTACEWWEFPIYLAFCRPPSYDYYFATDMNTEELKRYFKDAQFTERSSGSVGFGSDYTYRMLYFEVARQQGEFYINFYNETKAVKDVKNLQTDKKYIISMSEESYKLAKEAYKP